MARSTYGDEDAYSRLLRMRSAAGEECSPEQQAGPDATECGRCRRLTVHQHAKVCMACGFDEKAYPGRPDSPATVDPSEIPTSERSE